MKCAIMAVYAAIVKINHATFPRGIGGANPTLPHHFLCDYIEDSGIKCWEHTNGGRYDK